MLRAGSVPELWRCGGMVFIMETGLWRPENAHFFPLRGRVTASAVYHPHVYGEKPSYTCRQIHWILVPVEKNRVLYEDRVGEVL